MSGRINVHATGIVLDGKGVLLRGPSGSGKSLLALALIDLWHDRGLPADLVADDRLDLEAVDGRLVMHAPPAIAGLIELRGRGIVSRTIVPTAAVALVADLVETLDRMPAPGEFLTELLGVSVARCPLPRVGPGGLHQLVLIREALRMGPDNAQKALE